MKMRCADVKMCRCEDAKMTCAGVNVKRRRCEDEKKICVDVKKRG